MSTLDETCDALLDLDNYIEHLEGKIKAAKQQRHRLATDTIPMLMAELGFQEVVRNGRKITLRNYVSGSIPKDTSKRQKAMAWLTNNGGEGLIKSEVRAPFPKSQHETAVEVYSHLHGAGHAVSLEESVHPSSLQAWVRQRIEEGSSVDADVLGLSIGTIAKITT